jgi:O-acetyl-ADP-ribose deacetylase (regulator of RNase III)
LLRSCYATALDLAAKHLLHTISFSGDLDRRVQFFLPTAPRALRWRAVTEEIEKAPRGLKQVVFCCFSPGIGGASQGRICRAGTLVARTKPGDVAA